MMTLTVELSRGAEEDAAVLEVKITITTMEKAAKEKSALSPSK